MPFVRKKEVFDFLGDSDLSTKEGDSVPFFVMKTGWRDRPKSHPQLSVDDENRIYFLQDG